MSRITSFFLGLVLALSVTWGPSASAIEAHGANRALWYCQAQSYVSGLWYYWESFSALYARNMALRACVLANGYTCTVSCDIL